jgi:hypothetical protein
MARSRSADPLPYHVRRVIRAYKPHLRVAITEAVQKKYEELRTQQQVITVNDICECVAEVLGSGDRNWRMEQMCRDAVDHGDYRRLKDVIDELRASIAGTATA